MIKKILILSIICTIHTLYTMEDSLRDMSLDELKNKFYTSLVQQERNMTRLIYFAQKIARITQTLPRYSNNQSPLHLLCQHTNNPLIIPELVRLDPNSLDEKDTDGLAPIHYACLAGKEPIIRVLLSSKANPNNQTNKGWTPLHYICANNQTELALLLLTHGANPEITDAHAITPLILASRHQARNPRLSELLIAYAEKIKQKKDTSSDKSAPTAPTTSDDEDDISEHILPWNPIDSD